jgi:cell wall assembly regulator SMI1
MIGRRFSPDFRASLLIHDGSDGAPLDHGEGEVFPWLPGCAPLRSLADICKQWKEERDWDSDEALVPQDEATKRINNVMRHPARIPIAGNQYWDADNTYLDFVPAANGVEGQVIAFSSECDLEWLGGSFLEALAHHVRALESGAWTWQGPAGDTSNENRTTQFAAWIAETAKAKPAKTAKAKPAKAKAKPAKATKKPVAKAKKSKASTKSRR